MQRKFKAKEKLMNKSNNLVKLSKSNKKDNVDWIVENYPPPIL